MVDVVAHVATDSFHGEENENYLFAKIQKCCDIIEKKQCNTDNLASTSLISIHKNITQKNLILPVPHPFQNGPC